MPQEEQPASPWKATEPDPAEAIAGARRHPDGEPVAGYTQDDLRTQREDQRTFGEAHDRLTDSGVHRRLVEPEAVQDAPTLDMPAVEDDDVEKCEGCGRRMPTDYELIQASIAGVSATDLKHLVAVPFYERLFAAAPDLIPLFPPDMCYPIYGDPEDPRKITGYERHETGMVKVNPNAGQLDLIVSALIALAGKFDRHDPRKIEALDRELAKLARSHTRFHPPAKIEEYAAVVTILLIVLTDVLGDRFDERTEFAWRKALEYASGKMLAGQAVAKLKGRGRRRREV